MPSNSMETHALQAFRDRLEQLSKLVGTTVDVTKEWCCSVGQTIFFKATIFISSVQHNTRMVEKDWRERMRERMRESVCLRERESVMCV